MDGMTKGDTVLEIMRLNPSAGAEFLGQFSEDQLAAYLRRLSYSSSPRFAVGETPRFASAGARVVAGAA